LSGDDDGVKARRARQRLPKVKTQTPTEREEEDLQVAGFYQNDGDYRGAYLRGKDAVSVAADDPNAHFVLAEAARKLGKLDEAMEHYKTCLKLDPIPKEKKVAEKALKEMEGGG
jgi:Tfp pilus assembly protein PilF